VFQHNKRKILVHDVAVTTDVPLCFTGWAIEGSWFDICMGNSSNCQHPFCTAAY